MNLPNLEELVENWPRAIIDRTIFNPVLIRIQTCAGHGSGKPTSVITVELADIYAFIANKLD